MTSDGTGASGLGESLGAVESDKGETRGESAMVGRGAESVIRFVGSAAAGGGGAWSTTVPAIAATRTELASAARVQSNRDRWTRLTAGPPATTLGFEVGGPGGSICNSDSVGSGANSSSPPVVSTH
jgi:hypothetical protein